MLRIPFALARLLLYAKPAIEEGKVSGKVVTHVTHHGP